jgi:CRP-like cAMP-binding protein
MLTKHFLERRRRQDLNDDERLALESVLGKPVTLPKRTPVTRRGESVTRSTFLISGFMCRYLDASDGHRQIVSIDTPGDFVDLHGYPLQRLDHDIATLSECQVAYASHDRITTIVEAFPHLGRLLWFSTLVHAAMHREWIFRLGRLDAIGRVAHLLCETFTRLKAVERTDDRSFDWPLTQQDMGEACGLTSVHVNRTLRTLRELDLADVSDRRVTIFDFAQLAKIGEFAPDYLYIDDRTGTP